VAATSLLDEVHATYVSARDRAMGANTFRLRWQAWRWERRHELLDQPALARLAAVRDELRDRGCSSS
jgi:hypothetical protein